MAEHIWSVLCHSACIDKSSNLISLLEVTERVNVPGDVEIPDELPEGVTRLLAPVKMQLASWWKRSRYDKPEAITGRLVILDVDGGEFGSQEFEVPLDEYKSYRSITALAAVPIDRGAGTMRFVVSMLDGDDWIEVARVPLEVRFLKDLVPPAQPGGT